MVGGCGLSEEEVTLAELDANAYVNAWDRGRFALGSQRPGDTCPVLSPGTTATMNGRSAARIDYGGVYTGSEGDERCSSLAFHWDELDLELDGPTTFDIADETASWTFVIWRPFYLREFDLASHPDRQIGPGDQVTAQIDVPEDGPLHTRGFVRGSRSGEVLFDLELETGDVILDGHNLHFTMPAIEPGELRLWIESEPTVGIDRCDAPAGCEVVGRAVSMLDAVIAL